MAAKEQVNQIGKKLISFNSSQSRLYLRVGNVQRTFLRNKLEIVAKH